MARRVRVIRISEVAGLATLLHGLFGLDNLRSFNLTGMIDQLITSVTDPSNLMQDVINAITIYGTMELLGKLQQVLLGKRLGVTFGNIRLVA